MRKEVEIVILGVALHALYLLSIFDIYFKSPIVHGIDPVAPRIPAPAKRLVLFVADGLRADKFFELKNDGLPRAPFLHSVMHHKGKWGVSHARPPTESRPGHVAIIAGFYEDPSAVTKGWKANPVEFDSMFNRSRNVISFGSPDIVPIFCGNLKHANFATYPHEYEDFATDASFLDTWVFDRFENFLNKSRDDPALKNDGLVIFLHLLGCDTNGHAHRPHSSIYLNNVEVVDRGVERVVKLVDDHFGDGQTAYVFTADHGMSDKGSHGDGDPANTETPLVAWGAGIRGPSDASVESDEDDGFKFVDEHHHHMPTPSEWGLQKLERIDVNQGDIASLMATLLGLTCPVNSVGVLPTGFLSLSKAHEAEAVFANAKQILNQFLRKAQIKQSTSMVFRPFAPLADHHKQLNHIEQLIDQKHYQASLRSSQELIRLSLRGLQYYQTYDWWFLMGTITAGYIGWMLYVLLHLLRHYTSFPLLQRKRSKTSLIRLSWGIVSAVVSIVLLVEKSPVLYFSYVGMAIFFWERVSEEARAFQSVWIAARRGKLRSMGVLAACLISLAIVQLLVVSFFRREVYTGLFLVAGVVGAITVSSNISYVSMIPAFVWATSWFLSGFTLMPPQIPEDILLVVGSGILVAVLGVAARAIDNSLLFKETCLRQLVHGPKRSRNESIRYYFQVFLVALSSFMVWITTFYRTEKRYLPFVCQVINWSLAGFSMLLPLKSPPTIVSRLSSIFLGFAPSFLLLSIGYEALFYVGLSLVLFSWLLVESIVSCFPSGKNTATSINGDKLVQWNVLNKGSSWRPLKFTDIRVAICFLVLINVAFFGTGNVASLASFEISSVYRFITIFNPFVMAALLMFKLFIPFILVTCAFSVVVEIMNLPRLGCYFIFLLLSDCMTIRFFFLVRNTGSWMEIGNTISHFGIMSGQVVFVLLLFALSSVFTSDIRLNSGQPSKLY